MTWVNKINGMTREAFIETFGGLFEHSPWVADKAENERPFSSFEGLFETMRGVVEASGREAQLGLLRKHPQLGAKDKMSFTSSQEQKGAGLDRLSEEEFETFLRLNDQYRETFGFPFILAVKGQTKRDVYQSLQERLSSGYEQEFQTALQQVYRIAWLRLQDKMTPVRSDSMRRTMSYGKGNVFAYRTFMEPLTGLSVIPESPFTQKDYTVFGLNVTVELGGEAFLPSFTEGDNSAVVATDSMKNFIQRHLGSFTGKTAEGFVQYVSEAFLRKYPHIEWVQMTAEELPFETAVSNGESGGLVFSRSRNEKLQTFIQMERNGAEPVVTRQYSEVRDLQLVKVKDNSFTGFIRDEYTTLPEDSNRPLFVYVNIGWTYEDGDDAYAEDPSRYAAPEQIRDIAGAVFEEVASPSIQSLIYSIGQRVLQRFPQLTEVTFESQNRTWDTVLEDIDGSEGKVYTEPRLPFGFQRFCVTRDDL
ncbi:factor-independent urate hydroxylase [Salibacterium qingdaonense]|uniref:Urate oxidase / 2-oxo-4-hydroxy-4-carboxy-5-ureidoimidazoline decarboxylase n=1 Tax=Salibacterium qingdaonense TaxID=266892 RepID=A0A1I4HY28_9BACI|nr:urate oxidase [Salibacterium qingdaonense]SFL46944.1 urate oxidase / 2-oxo-4-hydroxy-4-carboxy-5-ureidoimidazoline decarboxylase [Salibacterium qingdaonense]